MIPRVIGHHQHPILGDRPRRKRQKSELRQTQLNRAGNPIDRPDVVAGNRLRERPGLCRFGTGAAMTYRRLPKQAGSPHPDCRGLLPADSRRLGYSRYALVDPVARAWSAVKEDADGSPRLQLDAVRLADVTNSFFF